MRIRPNYPHFKIFEQRDWGLIVYDEVHLLPAPVFRVTAQIQGAKAARTDRDSHSRGWP